MVEKYAKWRGAKLLGNRAGLAAKVFFFAISFFLLAHVVPTRSGMPGKLETNINRAIFRPAGPIYMSLAISPALAEEKCEKGPAPESSIEETTEAGEHTWRIRGACEEESAISSGREKGGYSWHIGRAPSVEAPWNGDCRCPNPPYSYPPYYPFVDVIIKPEAGKRR